MFYSTDSIFDSPAQTLVNPVNTVGVMGAGLAKEFARRYPAMVRPYAAACASGDLRPGTLWLWRTPEKWVLCFPTKQHWRNPARLELIEQGLLEFVRTYRARRIESAAFPQLGCGLGGLDWETVQPAMERHLRPLSIPVWVHVRAQV